MTVSITLRTVFEIILWTLLPVVFTTLLTYAAKDNRYAGRAKFVLLVGIVFGLLAAFSTELGVMGPNDSVITTRNACVLCAGLFFGLPGGIIAGLIGAVERLLAAFAWQSAGAYTAWACAITTFIAGLVGGCLKSSVFKKKIPSVLPCALLAIIMEVFHCLLVFLFHLGDKQTALQIIANNAPLLIICNTIALILAAIVVIVIKQRRRDDMDK